MGGRALRLRVKRNESGNLILCCKISTTIAIFQSVDELKGYYRVAGSLRLQAAFVKRLAGNIGWDEEVSDHCKRKLEELLHRL